MVTGEDDGEALRRDRNLCEKLQVINLSVSLGGGGVESMYKHPESMTHTVIP